MYWGDDGPELPMLNVRASLIQTARATREGKDVERGVLVLQRAVPLLYDGPRTRDEMWAAGSYVDSRMVRVSSAMVLRCRPCFVEWRAEVVLGVLPAVMDPERLQQLIAKAGVITGLCDGTRIGFGRFALESFGVEEL